MSRTPNTLGLNRKSVESIQNATQRIALQQLYDQLETVYRLLKSDFDTLESKVNLGVSGWFDDGANFRVTVTDGIITEIADSTSGGHS